MSSSETISESEAERSRGVTGRARSLLEPVAPEVARQAGSGNLSAAAGVVSLVRAGRTFLKGNRKRGVLQALGGLFWVGVTLAQRRSGESRDFVESRGLDRSRSGEDLSEVVDTAPDVENAVEPGGRETDHSTGEEVVDTSNPAVETETAEESPTLADGVETGDVDQRDVVGSGGVEGIDEGGSGDEGEEMAGETEETETTE